MNLAILQSVTAMAPGRTTPMSGVGGTGPYTYRVLPGGSGGTIDNTGLYQAPAAMNSDPKLTSDTVQVTDSLGAKATTSILVTNALGLFCDIVQNQLGLASGRVYMWDQKIEIPKDAGIYVAVSVPRCKPFANSNKHDGSGVGLNSVQVANVMATLDIDIVSRGPDARDRKEEVVLALVSDYAKTQQEMNTFSIGRLPPGAQFINLSMLDGAAIPYRFRISVNMQYAVTKLQPVSYFSTFATTQVNLNP